MPLFSSQLLTVQDFRLLATSRQNFRLIKKFSYSFEKFSQKIFQNYEDSVAVSLFGFLQKTKQANCNGI